ncbi:MAG: phosphate propanoyltransferase [Oscillospiraceae bacterium]|nr:phosphate propanoyltransferase [Oscillospiraceae bacterium]
MGKFLVEVSARHIHLTGADVEKLFGSGHTLTKKRDLSQPGEFVCEERLTVVGPKREIANVSVLGPTRAASQIEISATDARSIGINAPVRESGDVAGSGGCRLVGPAGEIEMDEGVIVAKRHIHMTPEAAKGFEVENKQVVMVSVNSENRSLIFGDVVVRVSPQYALSMHIDTDEGNAAGLSGQEVYGEICCCCD